MATAPPAYTNITDSKKVHIVPLLLVKLSSKGERICGEWFRDPPVQRYEETVHAFISHTRASFYSLFRQKLSTHPEETKDLQNEDLDLWTGYKATYRDISGSERTVGLNDHNWGDMMELLSREDVRLIEVKVTFEFKPLGCTKEDEAARKGGLMKWCIVM